MANYPDKKPKIGETYENFELVFALCNLPKSKYWKELLFTADLKAIMIALGLCTCKGVYGCPHGECYKDKDGNWVCGRKRKFSEMLILVLRWLFSGGKKAPEKDTRIVSIRPWFLTLIQQRLFSVVFHHPGSISFCH